MSTRGTYIRHSCLNPSPSIIVQPSLSTTALHWHCTLHSSRSLLTSWWGEKKNSHSAQWRKYICLKNFFFFFFSHSDKTQPSNNKLLNTSSAEIYMHCCIRNVQWLLLAFNLHSVCIVWTCWWLFLFVWTAWGMQIYILYANTGR